MLGIEPPCVQAGTRQEVVLRGVRLSDIEGVMCRDAGVRVQRIVEKKILPGSGNVPEKVEVRVELEFAPDLPVGNVALHVRTRTGVSNPRTLHVNRLPIVAQTAAASKRETAQLIPLGRTVWGHIIGSETDWYAVDLAKDQRCSLEVLAYRISPTDLDAMLQVFGPDGKLLQEKDTSQLYYHDPVCSFLAPQAGRYTIALRDTLNGAHQGDGRYGMSSECVYVMHVGDYPQPKSLFPLGGTTDQSIEVEMHGDVRGVIRQTVKLPARPTFDFAPLGRQNNVWVFDKPDTAQVLPQPPFAVEGRIEKADMDDWYRFRLPKEKSWRVDVFARRLRSPMDPKLTLYPAGKNATPQENDDRSRYDMDSTLIVEGTGGEVSVRVADTRGEGGGDFSYRLVVDEALPEVNLTTASVEVMTLLPLFKTGHSISVPRGGRGLLLLEMQSDGTSPPKPLDIRMTGLPSGVKADVAKLPLASGYYPVVLTAGADAPLAGSFAKPVGKAPGSDGTEVPFEQRLGLVYSHPAQTAWHTERFSSVPIAVVEALPFAISLAPISEGVQPGKKVSLKLIVTRPPGAAPQPLTAMFPTLPPGVVHGTLEIPADAIEASFDLEVPAACPPGEWPLAIVVCDSDAAHLRNHNWPYYHNNNQNQAISVQGHHWTCAPLTYLRVLPAVKP
ncbi:MAG: PPC domain-containing protein [Verrucomicrobia bacterium]|nr:PPC domain-containing protein [Verrucomicrobiota bacterium]